MATYVAMLRGINVGGRAAVPMADLAALFGELGYEDVRTYIQSGNVVFRTAHGARGLAAVIEARIAEGLGLPVKVVLRTGAQLAAVLAGNPLDDGTRHGKSLHVTFLATPPAPAKARALDPGAHLPDEFRVVGREVYVHCPNGYGRTKCTNAYFERALGVVATTRNLNTVSALVRLST